MKLQLILVGLRDDAAAQTSCILNGQSRNVFQRNIFRHENMREDQDSASEPDPILDPSWQVSRTFDKVGKTVLLHRLPSSMPKAKFGQRRYDHQRRQAVPI